MQRTQRSQSWVLKPIVLCILAIFAWSCKTSKHLNKGSLQSLNIDTLGSVNIVSNTIYKGFETQYFDLIHTRLSVTPVWQLQHLEGTAVLTLTPHAYTQDTLVLDAAGFIIHKIELINKQGDSIGGLKYKYDQKHLKILPNNETKWFLGDTFRVRIKYTARPEDLVKEGLVPNRDEQGLYFINPVGIDSAVPRELWSQGETRHNSCWFPTIDAPDQKMTQEISITVDTGMTTLSNGTLDYTELNGNGTKTDHWSLEKPHSVYLAMIAVGYFTEIKDKWRDSIPVNYYVEPEYAPYARLIFGHTPAMIGFYSKLLKYDFPWPKYSQMVVRDFTSGAMENTTAVTMYDAMQHDDRANLDETGEDIISHELFHHWFGDLVTCKSWANLALNESFAQFAEKLWEEHEYGREEADIMFKTDLDGYLAEAAYKKEPIIQYYYNDPEDLFDKTRYEKGALVLNMLRHYLTDSVFFNALHNYLVTNAYKCVEISDLQKAMEQTSGKDLSWFFSEWFTKPGHPILEIRQQYNQALKRLYVFVNQTQMNEQTPVYKIPTEIDIYTASGMVEKHKVWLKHKSDTFSFDEDAPPLLVNFDAEKLILCHKSDVKPVSQWYYQYYHAPLLVDRFESVKALSRTSIKIPQDSAIKFWQSAIHDKSWYIRKNAILFLKSQPENIIDTLMPEIEKIAVSDKKSIVRADALIFMQENKSLKTNEMSYGALRDSSYDVVSVAIRNIFKTTPSSDSISLIKTMTQFDHYRSIEVLSSLAEIYGTYGDASKGIFFKNMSTRLENGYLTEYFLDYLKFLIRMNTSFIENNEKFILNLDRLTRSDWDRSSYKYFLNTLSKNLIERNNPLSTQIANNINTRAGQIEVKK